MRRALDWLDERTGYRSALGHALDEPVIGGASWLYVFGSVLTFILVLQIVTGILLAMYYSASASDAWASVAYIQDRVPFGWFVRGLHAHGASAMVIVAGLHLMQVATYGAYRRPREVTWLIGVLLLGLILAFALTGYLLPWDQKGYWATKVATGIMGSSPVIGGALQQFVQGGNEYGNLTLTRFFALHVFVLPALVIVGVVAHIALFRRHAVTPRWGRDETWLAARTTPFWPTQATYDIAAMGAAFAVLAAITISTGGVGLEAPADPGSGFDARPEWYFLPLFQMLKYFHGPMETFAALGVPAIVGGVLLSLPFVDRSPDRSPWRRTPYLGALCCIVLGAGALIYLARADDAADRALAARVEQAGVQARLARKLAADGVPPQGGMAVFENRGYAAQRLFVQHCVSCHGAPSALMPELADEARLLEPAARSAPDLDAGYGSRAWLRGFLANPDAPEYMGRVKKVQALGENRMPPAGLAGAELDAVVEWLYAQTGARDAKPELVAQGSTLIEEGKCTDCHMVDGETPDIAPNLGERGSREYLESFIARPDRLRHFGKANEMPVFHGKLSEEEIRALAGFVHSLSSMPAATGKVVAKP